MIEVIGPDGRTHVFAEGTTEAQIDAAMAALYPPEPAQTAPAAPRQWTPPAQPQIQPPPLPPASYEPMPAYSPPQTRGISTPQIIGGAVIAAAVTLAVIAAFMLGKGKDRAEVAATTPPPTIVAPTNGVTGPALVPVVPGTPTVTPEAFAGFIATQQGGNLNVRTAPDQNAPVVTKLPHGAPVSVTGSVMLADGLWRQLNIAGSVGYVKGEYISQTQPAAIAPAPPVSVPIMQVGAWGTVTTVRSDTVNMRASPSLSARAISAIPYGAEVWIISRQGDWYLVEWGGKRGWASKRFIVR